MHRLWAKFVIGIGLIVFLAVGTMSVWFYEYVKTVYVQQTFQKTDLVFGHVDATMEYIRDELRPKMFHILPKDQFVLEGMSTSFVNKGVMSRFTQMFPGYIYRRVALNPMVPENKANSFERHFIEKFSRNPHGDLNWKGLVSRGDREFFIHLKGVVMEKECNVCHGDPSISPKSLVARYGKANGHNWPEGKVVGLVSMAIPMDTTFTNIREVAFSVFFAGLTGVALLTLFLYYFYYVVAQVPLQKTSAFFKSVVSGEKGLDVRFEVKGQDEISELADSFNHMITHLQQSQENLVASEFKYRRIFEGSKDAIIIADAGGQIHDMNNSGLDLLGCTDWKAQKDILLLQDLFVSETSKDDFFTILETMGFVKDYETVFRQPSGGEVHVLLTANCRQEDAADCIGIECIIKDITERKKMEMQIRQADKLASLGQLAAGVAHEINNPLSIILGYTKFLKTDADSSTWKDDLEIIFNNAEMCKKIVEDLLNFARQTKTRISQVDLHDTIEAVIGVVEKNFAEENVVVIRDYDKTIGIVTLDVGKMQQVFMNMIMNAFQAMKNGGKLTITTKRSRKRTGFMISFADTGCGVSPSIREKIFDPFFTTKDPGHGTGLGLAVSYGIIEEHGGSITLESGEEGGAVFTIWLPETVESTSSGQIR